MKFTTANEAKKWLRGLPLLKKELELKAAFYKDLINSNRNMGEVGRKYITYYAGEIVRLQEELKELTEQMDRILEVLDPDERVIFTARYVRGLLWDALEFHVHYSRRQAIRIHNQAIERLVGMELGGNTDDRKEKRDGRETAGAGNCQTAGALALR